MAPLELNTEEPLKVEIANLDSTVPKLVVNYFFLERIHI